MSFASKFAHFFVDPERFPIKDQYVAGMLDYHLGRKHRQADGNYASFVADFNAVRAASGHNGLARELDYYLWISGMYRKWRRKPDAKMNREATRLFANPPAEVAVDLKAMMGDS